MKEENETHNINSPTPDHEQASGDKRPPICATRVAKLPTQHSEQPATNSTNPDSQEKPAGRLIRRWHIIWHFITEPKHSNAVTAIFTLLLFLSTAIYTIFAAFQWIAVRDSNALNRQGLFSVQRAFVYMSGFQGFRRLDENKRQVGWVFAPQWFNSGNTPATKVLNYVNSDWRPQPLPERFNFPDKPTGVSIYR